MADLTTNFAGIRCPNPFWLASGPPTNCGEQIMRAFDAGWGGAVWKTIGEPIVNVSSRYSSVDWNGQRMMGLNNIELISDRPIETNLREIAEVKKRYPKHAVIASLMVESTREAWHDIVKRSEDAGADGLELNFGCPHGMSERGMGSGGRPGARLLLHDHRVGEGSGAHTGAGEADAEHHRYPRRGARRQARRRRRALRHQHDQLDHRHRSRHLHAAAQRRRQIVARRLLRAGREADRAPPGAADRVATRTWACPISGIGGIGGWREAAEFILLGCGTVQVCTAAMHYGFRIVEDMIDGLSNWMDEKGFRTIEDFRGLSVPKVTDWKHLDLNYKIVARINREKCIGCDLCYVACWDGAHQCIHLEGHAVPAAVEAASRASIAVTPIAKLDAAQAALGITPAHRIPRVDEARMRGLQSLLAGLPGGELHHDGESGDRPDRAELGAENRRVRIHEHPNP